MKSGDAPIVLVSGCYDLLHSGHVRFFESAAVYGNLYVSIASDTTIRALKSRPPVTTEAERLYLVKAIKFVTEAFISKGSGSLNFLADFRRLKPDFLVVNEDGDSPGKAKLCRQSGAKYIVLKREPKQGLPKRSTTALLKTIKNR